MLLKQIMKIDVKMTARRPFGIFFIRKRWGQVKPILKTFGLSVFQIV